MVDAIEVSNTIFVCFRGNFPIDKKYMKFVVPKRSGFNDLVVATNFLFNLYTHTHTHAHTYLSSFKVVKCCLR